MPRAERKYTLDTNCFIQGFRTPDGVAALQQFHRLFAPFEYLSVVVAQELRAGTRSVVERRKLERHVLAPYIRTGRVLTPSAQAWHDAGDVLSELVRREGLDLGRVSKAFGNDILLALSCREAGVVLVTANTRDFSRIARIAPFDFVSPWPTPTA
jgi:predicted nucleic acid-binding protein